MRIACISPSARSVGTRNTICSYGCKRAITGAQLAYVSCARILVIANLASPGATCILVACGDLTLVIRVTRDGREYATQCRVRGARVLRADVAIVASLQNIYTSCRGDAGVDCARLIIIAVHLSVGTVSSGGVASVCSARALVIAYDWGVGTSVDRIASVNCAFISINT